MEISMRNTPSSYMPNPSIMNIKVEDQSSCYPQLSQLTDLTRVTAADQQLIHNNPQLLQPPPSYNISVGSYSPASDYSGYNNNNSSIGLSSPSSSSRSSSQLSPAPCASNSPGSPGYFLSSAANTLNNYGVTAYNLDGLDSSFNSTFDNSQENSWASLNNSLCDSPSYPTYHTPSHTPAPPDMELPPDEPSLQLMENLNLRSSDPPLNNSFNSLPNNIFQTSDSNLLNSYSVNNSLAPSPVSNFSPNQRSTENSNNLFASSPSNSLFASNASPSQQYTPQFMTNIQNNSLPVSLESSNSLLAPEISSNFDDINEEDLLNPRTEYNLQHLISSEGLGSENSGPSSIGSQSAPAVPHGKKSYLILIKINSNKITTYKQIHCIYCYI